MPPKYKDGGAGQLVLYGQYAQLIFEGIALVKTSWHGGQQVGVRQDPWQGQKRFADETQLGFGQPVALKSGHDDGPRTPWGTGKSPTAILQLR